MWFISLLTAVPSLISGAFGTINGITKGLSDAKIASIKAMTQEEKIEADERVATLQARRDVLVNEPKGSLNAKIRTVIAIGPASVVLKIFLWDKVIGSVVGCSQAPRGTCGIFVTDPLDGNLWTVVSVVLGFYFVSEVTIGVTRLIKAGGK